jgi:hypothetical protein
MRYIYYIIGILCLITLGLAVWLNTLKLEVSDPALKINDRIISESELEEFKKVGSYHSQGSGFLDAVIIRELLIQEAIRQGIHKEEAFRKKVEAYYEESLVERVVDRKYKSLSPEVTADMVERYKEISDKTVEYTKLVYETKEDIEGGKIQSTQQEMRFFEDLSDTLQISLFQLSPGESSLPDTTAEGVVVYRLDRVSGTPGADTVHDDDEVKTFLEGRLKEAMFEQWLDEIEGAADIEPL